MAEDMSIENDEASASLEDIGNLRGDVDQPEEETRRGIFFPDNRTNIGPNLNPATAGGPSFESSHPISRFRGAIDRVNQEIIDESTYMAVRGTGGTQRVGRGGQAGPAAEGGRPPGGGIIGRRELLMGGAAVAGGAALAVAELQTGWIEKAVNFFRNKDKKAGVLPATQEPDQTGIPTVEATPAPEPEKSPYEFGFSKKVGDVTVQITKQTQERTECPDPASSINSAKLVPCAPMHEITVNKDVFPDAEDRVKRVFEQGIYFAWKNADLSRKDVTFEEYMSRASGGENMSIKARGFQGGSFLPTEITINPTDVFFYDTIHEPNSIIRPWTSLGVGYRVVQNKEGNNEFHLEIFDFTAGGVADPEPLVSNFGPSSTLAVGLSYLSFPDIQKSGTFITQKQNEDTGSVVIPLRNMITTRVDGIPYGVFGAK